jgi:nitrilase
MGPSTKESVRVAVIQHSPVFLNLAESLVKAGDLVEEAAGKGAQVIVFPETWLPGYPVWLDYAPKAALWDHPPAKALFRLLVENSVSVGDASFQALLHMADKADAHVVMGVHERVGGTLYNTIIYVDRNGQDFQLHRKLVPTYTERMIWGRGDGSTLGVVETGYGNLGGLICWEHWMPLARAAMHAQQEVLHVAQWPAVKDLHQIASRHYAFEGQCFVIAAGSVLSRGELLAGYRSLGVESEALEILESIPGRDDDLVLHGGSGVIRPDTSYAAGPVSGEACILYADLELGLVAEGNLALDTSGHYSRPDVFSLEVDDEPRLGVVFRSGGGG